MPARPSPLITKGHGFVLGSGNKSPFSPLPSELPRTPVIGQFDALRSRDEVMKTPITPPTAYTEFLKNTINSPAIASPTSHSLPYTPATLSAGTSYRSHHGYYTPATPYPAPLSAPMGGRRSARGGLPPSPTSAGSSTNSSPSTESPRSGGTRRCPVDDDDEADDSGSDHEQLASEERVTVKQVVTTTVTYSTPRMSLMPAPKGKRRRIA
jgi:hypothetical protein